MQTKRVGRDGAAGSSLLTLAARQSDLVTRAQLLALGIDDMTMYRRARSGLWQRVLPAVYALQSGAITVEQRRVAAALYGGDGCQIAGLSALSWYGFRYLPDSDSMYLLVPHATRRKSAGYVRIQRTHDLDEHARRTNLYLVCSPARAVVDACRELRDARAVRAIVAESIQRGFCSLHNLQREIVRAARSRTALVRDAFHEVADGALSAPEGDVRTILQKSSVLPRVLWNRPLRTRTGLALPTPDGWIADVGIAIEVDSQEYHYRTEDWKRTLERHNVLGQHGILVLHFTPADIRENPAKVRRVVEEAYASRKAAGVTTTVLAGSPSTA
jgi:Transcriptional regulator, AbiEi antitoxin